MSLRQAAQQAFEALIPLANASCPNERECLTDEDHERAAAAVEALLAALVEPERLPMVEIETVLTVQGGPAQEPVAWMDREGDVYKELPSPNWCPPHTPLYAHPPTPRKPVELTDEELLTIYTNHVNDEKWGYERALIAEYEAKQGEQT